MSNVTVHASAVVVGDRGVLVRGPSGSGKSSLVLQLLEAFGDRAALIADDGVALAAVDGRLIAAAPEPIAGAIEARGLAIVRRRHVSPAVIDLVVDRLPKAESPRLPETEEGRVDVAGIVLPRLFLPPFAGDGVARVALALDLAKNPSQALSR